MCAIYKTVHIVEYDRPKGIDDCHTLATLEQADIEFATLLDFDDALSSVYQAIMNREVNWKEPNQEPAVKSAMYTIVRAFRNRARIVILQAEQIEESMDYLDNPEEQRVRQELNREILYTMALTARIQLRGSAVSYNRLAALVKPVVPLAQPRKHKVPTQVYEVTAPKWDSLALQSLSIVLL